MLPDGYAHINSFIENNTNGKIKNLLSTSDIDKDTSIVLVNALHFLRPWNFNKGQIAFSDDKVYKAFKSNEYSVRDVKEDGDIDVLRLRYTKTPEEMAYSGNLHDYSMYIICDSDNSEVEGVNDFVKGLSTEDFKKLLDFDNYAGLSEYAEVDFVVPNFRAEFKDSLKQTLIDLGMTEGLDCDTLDMTDISENIVRIGDVIHGAFIETDEKGTEAAASTAVTMVKNDSFRIEDPKNVKHVVADTPYMFIVQDDTADVILFMGYIKEPAELQ